MVINRFSVNKTPLPSFVSWKAGTVGFLQIPTKAGFLQVPKTGILKAYLLSDILKAVGTDPAEVTRITARRDRKPTAFRRIRYFPVAYMNTFIATGGQQYGYEDETEVAIIQAAFSQFIQDFKE